MITVTKKDAKESSESLIRRFSRKVVQSGMLVEAKSGHNFEKSMSKRERRIRAITRRERKLLKAKRMRLGQK